MSIPRLRISVATSTDILSRGIDIDNIDLVINFDVPHDGEDYVHRIGRTARAEAEGSAYTLVSVKEQRKFQAIENLIGKEVSKIIVPDHLGEQPSYSPSSSSGFKPRGKKNFHSKGVRHK